MSEQNMPQNNGAEESSHTKEFRLRSEDVEQTKEFKIEKEENIDAAVQAIESKKISALTRLKALPKSAKIAIIAALISVVILLAVVITVQLLKSDNIENNSIIVYQAGNECVIRIDDKEITVSESTADGFKADKESKRVYYTVASSYDDGLYDLYFVQIVNGEIAEPSIIDYGIEKQYEVSDGKVYYLKFNTSTASNDGCVCDTNSRKISTFSANVEAIYLLGNKGIYFTKMHGESKVLYSFFAETPLEVSRDITNIYCYNKTEKPHIVFERKSGVSKVATELYIARDGGGPELICDNTSYVMYDNYTEGGNLYYFTSSQESVSWSYVISDEYAESDKKITKPNRLDYWDLFGVSQAYNDAYIAYQDKLIRDEIRAALDDTVAKGGFNAPVYTSFAYNGEKVFKIAQNVDPARVYSVSAFGDPKIVFENVGIKEGNTDMATLSEIAVRSGMEEVIDYACSIVTESVESNGMAVAVGRSGGCMTYELKDYDKSKTQFGFSDNGNYLFAFVRDTKGGRYTLFSNSLLSAAPSSKVTVAANVFDFRISEDSVVYLKTDTGKVTGDIFSYNGSGSVKISNAASAFMLSESDNVFVLKNHNAQLSEPMADYYAYVEKEEIEIGKNVVVSSFTANNEGSAAFIEDNNGETVLKIYNGGDVSEVCDGASQILLFM